MCWKAIIILLKIKPINQTPEDVRGLRKGIATINIIPEMNKLVRGIRIMFAITEYRGMYPKL